MTSSSTLSLPIFSFAYIQTCGWCRVYVCYDISCSHVQAGTWLDLQQNSQHPTRSPVCHSQGITTSPRYIIRPNSTDSPLHLHFPRTLFNISLSYFTSPLLLSLVSLFLICSTTSVKLHSVSEYIR